MPDSFVVDKKGIMHTITVRLGNSTIHKHTSEIILITASSNYSKIYCANECRPYTVARALLWFQQNLPPEIFIRPNRRVLVNKDYIRQINDQFEMELYTGETVSISRRRRQDFKKTA